MPRSFPDAHFRQGVVTVSGTGVKSVPDFAQLPGDQRHAAFLRLSRTTSNDRRQDAASDSSGPRRPRVPGSDRQRCTSPCTRAPTRRAIRRADGPFGMEHETVVVTGIGVVDPVFGDGAGC